MQILLLNSCFKNKKQSISFATKSSAAQCNVPSNLIPCEAAKSLQPGCSSRQQRHNEVSGQRGSKHVYKHVPFFMLRLQRSHSRVVGVVSDALSAPSPRVN